VHRFLELRVAGYAHGQPLLAPFEFHKDSDPRILKGHCEQSIDEQLDPCVRPVGADRKVAVIKRGVVARTRVVPGSSVPSLMKTRQLTSSMQPASARRVAGANSLLRRRSRVVELAGASSRRDSWRLPKGHAGRCRIPAVWQFQSLEPSIGDLLNAEPMISQPLIRKRR
jgi:hypothetical protein